MALALPHRRRLHGGPLFMTGSISGFTVRCSMRRGGPAVPRKPGIPLTTCVIISEQRRDYRRYPDGHAGAAGADGPGPPVVRSGGPSRCRSSRRSGRTLFRCCRFAPGEPFEQPFEAGHASAKVREFLADVAYVAADVGYVPANASTSRWVATRSRMMSPASAAPTVTTAMTMVKVSGVMARAPW